MSGFEFRLSLVSPVGSVSHVESDASAVLVRKGLDELSEGRAVRAFLEQRCGESYLAIRAIVPGRAPMFAACQDGGQFYDEATGAVVADYSGMIQGDSDMRGAKLARARFLVEFPSYRMES